MMSVVFSTLHKLVIGIGACVLWSAMAQAEVIKMMYQYGNSLETIQSCDGGKTYLIGGDSKAIRELRFVSNRMRTRQDPYPLVYATVEGKITPVDKTHPEEKDYDGRFLLSAVKTTRGEVPASCLSDAGIK